MSPPAYHKILQALEADIATGRLRPGQPVLSHRAAARYWQVSTATVTRAYGEAARRGLLVARAGAPTRVAAAVADIDAPVPATLHNLAINAPRAPRHLNAAALVRDAFARLAEGRAHALLTRDDPTLEEPAHREALADWLGTLGVGADPARLFITPGAQAGLLLALRTVAGEGAIACEPLVNPGLIRAAEFVGARLVPIAHDAQGPIPSRLLAAIDTHGVRTLHASPTCSNPLALHWSPERRTELAELAQRRRLWIIEDDDSLPLDPQPLPLCALAPERTLLVVGVSKLAGMALRMGMVHVPVSLAARFQQHLRAAFWIASPILGEILAHWQQRGLLAELARARRTEALEHQRIAHATLGRFGYRAPSFGLHGWLALAPPWDAQRLILRARQRGVALAPDAGFHPVTPDRQAPTGVRLSLSAARTPGLALAELARLLATSER